MANGDPGRGAARAFPRCDHDPEAQGMMRVVAAGYVGLARRVEQRVREAETA
jgi:hypothetical protein